MGVFAAFVRPDRGQTRNGSSDQFGESHSLPNMIKWTRTPTNIQNIQLTDFGC